MKKLFPVVFAPALLALALSRPAVGADPAARLIIDFQKPGRSVSPTMHGLFFEDINYAADGGLYAELVQNRSFEHRDALFAWTPVRPGDRGSVALATESPLNAGNPRYVRVEAPTAGAEVGLANSGFDGIPVRAGERYLFSVRARGTAAGLRARLEDENGRVIGESRLPRLTGSWSKREGALRATATTPRARLVVTAMGPGRADLDVISLFPENTWKKRRNGMRADLVQILAGMKPGFLRFPGGCIVEGRDIANAYRWKETIGDIAERPQNWNRWQTAGNPRAPQYYQTYGLGFFEYFQLCEDLGAEPIPVVNCGMACQYQTGELVPMHELGPWVQDALDLIEFANGPVTSKWGAKRAAMGHPRPFNMKYLGVGNEQWGEAYFERYKVFYDAIKAKYPEIQIVSTSGPGVDDRWWNLAWNKFRSGMPAQIVDEHYYRPPSWFFEQHERYDAYDRGGPKVFAGEFAAHLPNRPNNLEGALSEAAFMTGLLRNADVVRMASYAPLLAKIGHTQWAPDLIWFDNTRVYGTPSYYVQKLFAVNRPDTAFPVAIENAPVPARTYPGRAGVGAWATQAEFKDITITRDGKTLFKADSLDALKNQPSTRGRWEVVEGALRHTGGGEDARVLFGDPSWGDYTLSLKARKLGGPEGFLVLFQLPNDAARVWWNVGGWNNTEHGLELPDGTAPRVPGGIETGRWYDVRVELRGASIRCYLDGKLIHDVARTVSRALYAVAGRNKAGDETIVKVVNTAGRPVAATLDLRGIGASALRGRRTLLTGANLREENSLENPQNVAPREAAFGPVRPTFQHTFPAHSLTVLRLRAGRG